MKHLHARVAIALWALGNFPVGLVAQGEGGDAGAALFDVNLGLSLWTVVIFLGLVAVLWRFAWGPLLGAVEAREQGIQKALDESAERQAEATRLLEEHRAQLAEARRQAQEIIGEGKAAGERLRRDIEEKARLEAQGIVERARQDISREKDMAIAELRRESVELAMAAAARLMHQKLDAEQDRALVMDYVRQLSSAEDEGGSHA